MTTENEPIPGATTALYARIAELELELQRSHTSARGLDDRLGEQNTRHAQTLIELGDMRERAERAERLVNGVATGGCKLIICSRCGCPSVQEKDHDYCRTCARAAPRELIEMFKDAMTVVSITADRHAARHAADVASKAHAEALAEVERLDRTVDRKDDQLADLQEHAEKTQTEVGRCKAFMARQEGRCQKHRVTLADRDRTIYDLNCAVQASNRDRDAARTAADELSKAHAAAVRELSEQMKICERHQDSASGRVSAAIADRDRLAADGERLRMLVERAAHFLESAAELLEDGDDEDEAADAHEFVAELRAALTPVRGGAE